MRHKIIFVVSLFLLFANKSYAQTHPCDIPIPTNIQIMGNRVIDGFCHNLLDDQNQPITITAFNLYVDGVKVWSGVLTAIGSVSSSGMYYFETPKVTVPNYGTHSSYITVTTPGGENGPSNSIPFVLVATKASVAVNKIVK